MAIAQIEDRKKAFLTVFSQAPRFTWPLSYKEAYIKTLITLKELSRTELPVNTINNPEPSQILTIVEKYDTELSLFIDWQRRFESLGSKEIGLYKVPILPINETQKLKSKPEGSYELGESKDWVLSNIKFSGINTIDLMYSKVSHQQRTLKLGLDNFNEDIVKAIESVAASKGRSSDHLVEIKAALISSKRSVITIRFNISTSQSDNVMEIGADLFQSDINGKKLSKPELEKDRNDVIEKIATDFKLEKSTVNELKNCRKNPIVTRDVANKFQGLNNSEILFVRSMERFEANNIEEARLNEVVESELPNQLPDEIFKEASEYYNLNGTFSGFFVKNPHRKVEDAETVRRLRLSGAVIIGFKAYAIAVGPKPEYLLEHDDNAEISGHLKSKRIEWVEVEVDPDRGYVEVKNGKYSEVAQRVLLNQILQLA